MKKFISLFCAMLLIIGTVALCAVSASAAEAAQTIVDVKAGDEVSYSLSLANAPEKVVGCDFSVYYDSSAFELESVADFNNNTNEDEWVATINPDRDGEVIGNWSILRGVDFTNKRNIVTLNLKAKTDTSAHVNYYIRYLYGDSAFTSKDTPQITEYTLTCDVKLNGSTVLKDAEPELNVEKPQSSGLFVNSVTGKSEDANVNVPEGMGLDSAVGKSGSGSNSGSNSDNDSAGGNAVSDATKAGSKATVSASANQGNTPGTKKGSVSAATDAQGNAVVETTADGATVDQPKSSSGSSPVLWAIIFIIVVAAAGGAGFYVIKKRNAPAAPVDEDAEK